MLVFIDESGNPHPKDASTRPVCVAVSIREEDIRYISARLHALKRNILGKEEVEFKAKRLLTRGTFRRSQEKRELTEAFFDLLRNLRVTIFAVIMERPQIEPSTDTTFLPNQFRYLLQRCDLLAQDANDMATILFDGDYQCHSGLSSQFNAFLHRSQEGHSMRAVTDAPFFVDSKVTCGIQIADMAAGTIRIYEENRLFQGVPAGDPFLSAIKRFYNILEEKTVDQESPEGEPRPGFYRMPERTFYTSEENEDSPEESEENDSQHS